MEPDGHGGLHPKPKINEATGKQEDPLGFISRLWPSFAAKLRQPGNWWSIVGVIGLLIAFGHSILAMSGEETLAQVYREVESPKLPNFKKAAFIVFVYSLVLTAGISFLAVLLIPDEVRMKDYSDNLIGGLAMHVIGPPLARLLLNAFVVVVGFLILAGAVNTAIIGSNGVLNRVAEDGVMPDWFLKPHRRYGTTLSRALPDRRPAIDHDPRQPRRHVRAGRGLRLRRGVELRVQGAGDGGAALQGPQPAGVQGAAEHPRPRRRSAHRPDRWSSWCCWPRPCSTCSPRKWPPSAAWPSRPCSSLSSCSRSVTTRRNAARPPTSTWNSSTGARPTSSTRRCSACSKPYRKLVAIRSPQNLFMLEKALVETDPETTDVVVMTAKLVPPASMTVDQQRFRPLRPRVDDRRGRRGPKRSARRSSR